MHQNTILQNHYPGNTQARVILHPEAQMQYPHDNQKGRDRLAISVDNGLHCLSLNDILFCQAESNYSRINLLNGEKLLISKTLKWLEGLLPQGRFVRNHASYIVNLKHVCFVGKSTVNVNNNIQLPVSRSRRKGLLESLKNYCNFH